MKILSQQEMESISGGIAILCGKSPFSFWERLFHRLAGIAPLSQSIDPPAIADNVQLTPQNK